MLNLRSVSQYLFGRHGQNRPLVDVGEPQEEATHSMNVPRRVVDQKPGYQHFLMTGNMESESQSIHYRRYLLLQEMCRMADSDPRVNRILYKLSSDASENSFSINVEDGPGKRVKVAAQGVLDRCRYLINDKEHLRGWVESLLRDGDIFLQLMISPEHEIVQAKKLAAEMTFSRFNAQGEFPDDKKPYYQAKGMFTHEILNEFDAWEIVHGKWRSEDGKPYGSPLFLSGQKSVKRVDDGEDDMAIRRKLRAGLRFFFNVGTKDNPGSWEEVQKFKEMNKDSLENPVNAVSNIYGNGLTDMKAVQGDTQLGNKVDIDHFEGLISMVGLTPLGLLSGGREQATNLNVIDAEEGDYVRTLLSICKSVETGVLRPIFNTQLTISGINPDSIEYSLNWGAEDRETDYRKIQKGLLWIQFGGSHETAYGLADIDNGLSYEDELKRIEEQIDKGLVPYRGPLEARRSSSMLSDEKSDEKSDEELSEEQSLTN